MSDPIPPEEMPASDDLQFENAEYAAEAPAALTCAACSKPIEGIYYEVNGKALCDACRAAVAAQLGGGFSAARFMRACLFGTLAAVAGFIIYFAVLKITGIQAGIISVLVGFMVGTAVRAGSAHRGGLAYQVLAVALTYAAVAASYSAMIIATLFSPEFQKMQDDAKANEAKAKAARAAKPAEPAAAQPKAEKPPTEEEIEAEVDEMLAEEKLVPKNPMLAAVVLLAILFASPIAMNIQSPIGLLIVGFALWEAWKLNKRTKLVFNGPYQAGGQGPLPAAGSPAHG